MTPDQYEFLIEILIDIRFGVIYLAIYYTLDTLYRIYKVNEARKNKRSL